MVKRGPNTEIGKGKVRLNAVQHGILSSSPVIPGFEQAEDWQRHHDGILASLVPADELEAALGERISLLFWRLRRVAAFETEAIAKEIEETKYRWGTEERRRNMVTRNQEGFQPKEEWLLNQRKASLIPNEKTLERVTRYEAHLHRQLLQTMHELEALQDRRKGRATPLARLDVQVGEGPPVPPRG